jgi:predicted nucleic acid-binding protein
MLVYVDTSVLIRAYLADEEGHDAALELLDGKHQLFTATLTCVEITSLLVRAYREHNRFNLDDSLASMNSDISATGRVAPVRTNPVDTENAARAIVRNFAIRAQQAMHLATAELALRPLANAGEEIGFATRDDAQNAAAMALGFVDAL